MANAGAESNVGVAPIVMQRLISFSIGLYAAVKESHKPGPAQVVKRRSRRFGVLGGCE